MKTLFIALLLISSTVSAKDITVSYIAGGWSTHLLTSYNYNDTHDINGLAVSTDDYYISLASFTNSFHVKAESLALGIKKGDFVYGVNIATGYENAGLNNLGSLAVAPAISYHPKEFSVFRVNLVANALFVDLVFDLN